MRLKKILTGMLFVLTIIGNIETCRANNDVCTSCSVNVELAATMEEILQIEAVKVESVYYAADSDFNNVAIKSINKSNPSFYILSLSPMEVKVHTNMSRPIYVNAEFLSLQNGSYKFNASDLSFTPNQIVVNHPYDHIEVGNFTPKVITRTAATPGSYVGRVLFTLGAV